MSKTKPETYEELKKIWYAKLKKSGFKDIEDSQGRLIAYNSDSNKAVGHVITNLYSEATQRGLDKTYREAQQEYFSLASKFVHSHRFRSPLERRVWTMHADGDTSASIAVEVSTPKLAFNRKKVDRIVMRLRKIMLGGL